MTIGATHVVVRRTISDRRLHDESTIISTPRNKGLTMVITVTAYDRGTVVEVDGTPMSGDLWRSTQVVVAQKVDFLRRQLIERNTIAVTATG